jgi:hypothetical protein
VAAKVFRCVWIISPTSDQVVLRSGPNAPIPPETSTSSSSMVRARRLACLPHLFAVASASLGSRPVPSRGFAGILTANGTAWPSHHHSGPDMRLWPSRAVHALRAEPVTSLVRWILVDLCCCECLLAGVWITSPTADQVVLRSGPSAPIPPETSTKWSSMVRARLVTRLPHLSAVLSASLGSRPVPSLVFVRILTTNGTAWPS